jgi:hypothetical protein
MLPYTGSGQALITGSDEAATTGPAAEHPIGRRRHASRVDRWCTPVSPDSRETVCTRVPSGWIGLLWSRPGRESSVSTRDGTRLGHPLAADDDAGDRC